ncbi:pyridoxamine 5'-phosphate oxidase [Zoogloea sp.]|uniref:pyridoxamine 5'-phosphate oxidase n=1 Tax=Zoogloea sp. TaxID=49181 RepID=UPI0026397CBA|nr:pyridoxamine 5'-phosphate oxidase [Zoogloea sp.]MDD3353705.1 pyridoxamine 5'-phosphate oxidase [Zoogloea sp.]
MTDSPNLADLRKTYDKGSLNDGEALNSPLLQFSLWLREALDKNLPEPNAMTVATVGQNGRPSSRVVLIKGYDEQGIVWFTNYASRKGHELEQNPFAALQFHWVELERVVRIEGRVEKIKPEESDAYFASRPLSHRIGAWASRQSEEISNRAIVVARAAEYGLKFGLNPPRPPHWGGYRLTPDYWEFWQGRASRLHDRLAYRLRDGEWQQSRLSP